MGVKEEFSAYLPVPDGVRDDLWQNALVVFDTNALLQLYRYGPKTRDDVIETLTKRLAKRVWLPYHVGVEFFRNRPKQIEEDGRRVDSVVKELDAWLETTKTIDKNARLHELDIEPDWSAIRSDLNRAIAPLRAALEKARANYPNLRNNDVVVNFVSDLVGESVGPAPHQGEVDNWDSLATLRYPRKTPPGFSDAAKDGQYLDRGITYKNANGDLYLWMQLLDAVRSGKPEFSRIIVVTNDNKSDWWEAAGGKTVGPRVEIRQEIKSAGAQAFHMYTLVQFLEHLKASSSPGEASLSENALDEAKRTEAETQYVRPPSIDSLSIAGASVAKLGHVTNAEHANELATLRQKAALICVSRSLRALFSHAYVNDTDERADITVRLAGGLLGGHLAAGFVVRICESWENFYDTAFAAADSIGVWRQERSTHDHIPKVGVFIVLFDDALNYAMEPELAERFFKPAALQLEQRSVELQVGRIDGGLFVRVF